MMQSAHVAFLMTAAAVIITGCGSRGGAAQEQISGLRTLGVLVDDPLVNTPSSSDQNPNQAHIVIYAAVPLGITATVKPFVDSGSTEGALQLPISAIHINGGTNIYDEHNSFRLMRMPASIDLPTSNQFMKNSRSSSFSGGQISYGFTISTSDTEENTIANLNVFPSEAAQSSWKTAKLTLASPADGSTVSKANTINLTATVSDGVGENEVIGWFVSDGTVSNRRAISTTWKPAHTGPQTIVVVFHGVSSRGFAIVVHDVTVTD